MNKPYLIVTPGYNDFCGGIKVLHRLCHLLNEHGYDSYVTGEGSPPDWNVKFLSQLSNEEISEMQHTGIVVYPDVVWGNPLRFNNCVQYDLQAMRPIQTNMLGVSLCNAFETNVKADLTLHVFYIEDFFKLPEVENRKGVCYYQGKGKTVCPEPMWKPIFAMGRQELASLLQTSEYVVCADNMTQVTVESRLCGCPVIMNEESLLPWSAYEKDNFGMNGIILPYNNKTIEQAYEELPQFKIDYDARIAKNKEEMLKFIEVSQNRQVEYIHLIHNFPAPMFGIGPDKMDVFSKRN